MRNKTKAPSLAHKGRLTDAKLLLIITICVFVVMYVCAVLFLGSGFKKPQTFFNILNENAASYKVRRKPDSLFSTSGNIFYADLFHVVLSNY